MLKLEPRPAPSRLMSYASPLLAVLLTTLCGAILFALLGKNPLAGLSVFFWEPIKNLRGWTEIGVKCTPLILCAIGYAICYRSSVMSIGAEGMLVAGAIGGGGMALLLDKGNNGGAAMIALIV
ncbi:MAG: ABC transporter permease, partial [Burkholderiaceae bacterium]